MAIPILKKIDDTVNIPFQIATSGVSVAIDSNNSWQLRLKACLVASPVLAFFFLSIVPFSPLSIVHLPGMISDIHSDLLHAKTWLSSKLNGRRERNNNPLSTTIRPSEASDSFFARSRDSVTTQSRSADSIQQTYEAPKQKINNR